MSKKMMAVMLAAAMLGGLTAGCSGKGGTQEGATGGSGLAKAGEVLLARLRPSGRKGKG